MTQDDLQANADKWPSAFVSRTDIAKFTGGVITSRNMRVFDKDIEKHRLGRKVFYKVWDVLEYIYKNTETIPVPKSHTELLEEKFGKQCGGR